MSSEFVNCLLRVQLQSLSHCLFSLCVCLIPISVVGCLNGLSARRFAFVVHSDWVLAHCLFVIVPPYYVCFFFIFFLSQFYFWFSFVCWFSSFLSFVCMCVVFFFRLFARYTHNIWMRDIIRWFHKNIYFIACQEACAFIPDMYVCFEAARVIANFIVGLFVLFETKEKRIRRIDIKKNFQVKKKLKRHHTLVDLLINW